ncbi:MAG: CotH kinase family protein, partial [bacterium]
MRTVGGRAYASQFVRWIWVPICAALLLVLVVGALKPSLLQKQIASAEARWGASLYAYDRSFAEKISILVGGFLFKAKGLDEFPELILDLPYKSMSKIYAKREEALARGKLIKGEDDLVKGTISHEGRTLPVKLRLKGDWNDHLAGRKWSFRVMVRNGEQLFGMRRFSIQSPATRGYQAELLFFEALKSYGVMTPRYSFVNVILNGEPLGLMALEEFFSKELLEYNQRREGVIVRFDESHVWGSRDGFIDRHVGWKGAFDSFENAPIDAFGSSRIAASTYLSRQYEIAYGLLSGFIKGDLQTSQVFDAEQLGAYLAVSDVFGASHTVAWSNVRFYLNPISMLLEPIAFDANLQDRAAENESIINTEPLVQRFIQDPLVMAAYQRALTDLADSLAKGELQQMLQDEEALHLPGLRTEFRLLGTYPLAYLTDRADFLLERFISTEGDLSGEFYSYWEREKDLYSRLAHVRLLNEDNDYLVEIDNAIPMDTEVIALRWVNGNNSAEAIRTDGLPISLPARGLGSASRTKNILLTERPVGEDWELQAEVRIVGRPWTRTMFADKGYKSLTVSPIPSMSLQAMLERFPFVVQGKEAPNQLLIKSGSWDVTESLLIPSDYSLLIEAGARLNFASDALFIINGPVSMEGAEDNRIIMQALDGNSWPGLLVRNASQRSEVRHVEIRQTSGVTANGWSLTGGVNFYQSDVNLEHVTLRDSQGEDALNI